MSVRDRLRAGAGRIVLWIAAEPDPRLAEPEYLRRMVGRSNFQARQWEAEAKRLPGFARDLAPRLEHLARVHRMLSAEAIYLMQEAEDRLGHG